MTPHRTFEYHSARCALSSGGSSTKSARGFSSRIREKDLLSDAKLCIVGVMFR